MSEAVALLSPASCRAARALLRMNEEDLARLAQISVVTLRRFEVGSGSPSEYAAKRILGALEAEGVMFVGANQQPALK